MKQTSDNLLMFRFFFPLLIALCVCVALLIGFIRKEVEEKYKKTPTIISKKKHHNMGGMKNIYHRHIEAQITNSKCINKSNRKQTERYQTIFRNETLKNPFCYMIVRACASFVISRRRAILVFFYNIIEQQ